MGCCSNQESNSCSSQQSGCSCPCHSQQTSCSTEGELHQWLLEVADEAWEEVLKDKIKEHILATQKERMTELAKIVSEGNSQRWKMKMEKKKVVGQFKEQLTQFFGQKK